MPKRLPFAPVAALVAGIALFVALTATMAGAACTPTPAAGCKLPFKAGKSSLKFTQTGATDPDDIYTWRWNFGSHTDLFLDLGSPTTSTGYALCIYDASGRSQPVVGNAVPGGANWKPVKFGYLLDFPPSSQPLRRLLLKAGPDGKAHILAHGDSDTVAQILPFVAPVVVQLQNDDGICWETTLTTPTRDDDGSFRSKD
jgi:hypothetical protein